MSRNPYAGSLRNYRQRIVPNKRRATTAYDPADYLVSEEAITAYLDAYLEDGTEAELEGALVTASRARHAR